VNDALGRLGTPGRRRLAALFLGLAALGLVLGAAGLGGSSVGAQDEEKKAAPQLTIQRVDARSQPVVVNGNVVGVDPSELTATANGDAVESSVRSGGELPLDAVAIIDNAQNLPNSTVQLAKQALAPLLPGQGVVDRLAVVTTGGGATVQSGLTASAGNVTGALADVAPTTGGSDTWQAMQRAAELLESSEGRSRSVILFSASPPAGSTPQGVAETALRQARAQLDAVVLPLGTDVGAINDMVAGLGGYITQAADEEQLDESFAKVSEQLAGRFEMSFQGPDDADRDVDLAVTAGSTTSSVQYVAGSVRTGSAGLVPVVPERGLVDRLVNNSLMMWVVVLLGVGAIVIAVWALLSMIWPDENNLVRRLKVYEDPYGENAEDAEEAHDPSVATVPILRRAVDFTGDMAQKRGVLENLEGDLERANLPLRAAEAMFFVGAGALLIGVVVGFVTRNPLMALVAVLVSVFLPKALLNMRVRKRQKAFEAQLPDMLALMAGTLRAGYSIGQGFEAVSKEIDDPMGRELRRVVTENRLGRPLDEALEAVADRMQSDDFSWAVMAIRIQREVGGNLAELLLTVANTMTQRERLRRDVATLTAEGRISAIVLGFLPPALGVVMWVMNPAYIQKLFEPGLGYFLLGGALVAMLIGFAWMKKIITIEV
jgi:tight adherence protein B